MANSNWQRIRCDVMERLIRLSGTCNLISLLGNHEETMLDARRDAAAEERWRDQGGGETIYSYGDSGSIEQFPSRTGNP
jgi:hypothetical protein